MLEVGLLRGEKSRVLDGLRKKNCSTEQLEMVDAIIALDDQRKAVQTESDKLLNEIKILSNEIGGLFKSGQADLANAKKEEVSTIKDKTNALGEQQNAIIAEIEEKLLQLPNVPHESVPEGKKAEDNEVYQDWTKPFPSLYDGALPHWELAEKYNLFSLSLGVKLTGAGFPVYRGKGAKLQRALISFFLDEAIEAGYEEIMPPLMVNEDSAKATGQLPDKEGQMYHATKDNLYLIPTAEVPITNIYRDVIVDPSLFPIKMTGYTPCFRREAGSYGADVKGLNRVHQFDKVEIVQIVQPENSYSTQHLMLEHVSKLLDKLELPYRILRLCGGDMSFASALTFDFEVYSAAQGRWLEVSSVSNFETFQSNRLMVRYKDETGKSKLAHTLNGSALALARIVASIMENHQTPDGIKIPEVLIKYTGFDLIN